jgi:hypothetical protein
VENLRAAIHHIFHQYEQIPSPQGCPLIAVCDDSLDRYALIQYGFDGRGFGSYCAAYLELKGDKIWIQVDRIEGGLATDLLREGIGSDQIVLGFREPKLRPFTGFAIE